jgi:hypothetical protein
VTTEEVLSEFLAHFSGYGTVLRQAAVRFVESITNDKAVGVRPQSHESFVAGLDLYKARPDKGYSHTDCISMVALSEVKAILPRPSPVPDGHVVEDGEQIASRGDGDAGTMSTGPATRPELFGAIASFDGPESLLEATARARRAGYERLDAFSPFPVHGMSGALGLRRSPLPWMVLGGGLVGAVLALTGMLYINVVEYPIVVGGKPHGALEPLLPITFEVCVLIAALTTVFGMFFLNGLPRLHHPLFRLENFARTTDDGFFLIIDASDPRFETEETMRFLESLGGAPVMRVEA